MSDSDSEDEDNDYVVFGTRLEDTDNVTEASSGLFKKPAFMEQRVLNERGRAVRFHGAFTGGFSAGYFNTVGSKEGFAPVAFRSNRSDKGALKRSLPEDYMDEEDFGEHGIAPRRIKAAFQFDDSEARRLAQQSFLNSLIPDEGCVLRDILVPSNMTMGMKLLRKLGWREASLARRGISKDSSALDEEARNDDSISESKPTLKYIGKISEKHPLEETTPITFAPKTNTMGLGYSGIKTGRTDVLTSGKRKRGSESIGFNPDCRPIRMGIRGKGFGVGALENEDADIYANDDMSNYDWSLDIANDNGDVDDKFGWTAPSHIDPSKPEKIKPPAGYVGKLLPGFTVLVNCLTSSHSYAPPSLPPNYKPRYGVFRGHEQENASQPAEKDKPSQNTPASNSVFDLMNAVDRSRLLAIKSKTAPSSDTPFVQVDNTKIVIPKSIPGTGVIVSDSRLLAFEEERHSASVSQKSSISRRWDQGLNQNLSSKPLSEPITIPESSQSANNSSFKDNPEKLARYQLFLQMKKTSISISHASLFQSFKLTEWEKAQELKEFEMTFHKERGMSDSDSKQSTPSSENPRPFISNQLAQRLASRFTHGGVQGSTEEVVASSSENISQIVEVTTDLPGGIISREEFLRRERLSEPSTVQVMKSEKEQAAEMGMYGSVTRTIEKWHPGRILCRRFNVPDPYPDSDIMGLPKVKRDKFSVFDFLEDAGSQSPPKVTEMVPGKSPLLSNAKNLSGLSIEEKRKNLFSVLFQEPDKNESQPVAPSETCEPEKTQSVPPVPDRAESEVKRMFGEDPLFVIDTQPSAPIIQKEHVDVDGEERPPINLFKSIFASDEETSSEEEEVPIIEKKETSEAPLDWLFQKGPNPRPSEDHEDYLPYGPQIPVMGDQDTVTSSLNADSEMKYLSIEEYSKTMKKTKKASKHKKTKKKDKKTKHKHKKEY